MGTNRFLFLGLVILAANSLISCALRPQVPETVVVNQYANTSAEEAYHKVQIAYSNAQSEGLRFFAPGPFQQGKTALSNAAALRRDKAEDIEILKYLYLAEQQLTICRQVKLAAEQKIPDVLSGLEGLRARSVEQSYRFEFNGLLNDTAHLLSYIEDSVVGKTIIAQAWQKFDRRKEKLMQDLHLLEIKVVKYNTLNESQIVFKEVVSLGGKSLAPKTFAEAEEALQEAHAIIEKNVKDDAAIDAAGKKYKFAVFHALHVARDVDELQSMGRSNYEDYILDLEKKLQPIAEALHYGDMRNHTLHEQMQLLTGLATRMANQESQVLQQSLQQSQQQSLQQPPASPVNQTETAITDQDSKLQEEHRNALQKIEELTAELARLQNTTKPGNTGASEDAKNLRRKSQRLEQQVLSLTLENNNLKAQRDSLQKKLNVSAGQ